MLILIATWGSVAQLVEHHTFNQKSNFGIPYHLNHLEIFKVVT